MARRLKLVGAAAAFLLAAAFAHLAASEPLAPPDLELPLGELRAEFESSGPDRPGSRARRHVWLLQHPVREFHIDGWTYRVIARDTRAAVEREIGWRRPWTVYLETARRRGTRSVAGSGETTQISPDVYTAVVAEPTSPIERALLAAGYRTFPPIDRVGSNRIFELE